jgi:hypothetical protein
MEWSAYLGPINRDKQYAHLIAEADRAEDAGNVWAAQWLREKAGAVWEESQAESQPFVA